MRLTQLAAAASWERLRTRLARRFRVDPVTPDRRDDVCAFFREAYRDQPTAYAFEDPVHVRRHWEWINEVGGVGWICTREGRVVGHFAATRAEAATGGALVPIRWGRDLIVSPEERQAGVGPFLIVSAIESEPTPFLIAGLNEEVYPIYQRLGFVDLGRIPLFVKVYQPERLFATVPWSAARRTAAAMLTRCARVVPRSARRAGLAVTTIERFDDAFDRFWASVETALPNVVRRTSASMTWRYRHHPDHRYTVLAAHGPAGLRGIAVVRRGRSRGLPAGFITELLTAPGDTGAMLDLVDEAERLLTSEGESLAFIRCAVRWKAQERALRSAGFLPAPSPLHFMMAGVQGHPHESSLIRGDDWFLNTGDSDLDAI